MTGQATAEIRRAELVRYALRSGVSLADALALAAGAEAFITGAISAEAILQIQPVMPAPDKLSAVSHQPSAKDARLDSRGRARKPAATGKWLRWSAEETAYLKQAWPASIPIAEVMARLKGRDLVSIRGKLKKLGLKRSPEYRSEVCRLAAQTRHDRLRQSEDPGQPTPPTHRPKAVGRRAEDGRTAGLDPAFAAEMAQVVAWLEERGEAVSPGHPTGNYLFRGDNITPRQLVAEANAVRGRLGEPLFVLPDSDPPSGPGMGTAAAMVAEAGP